MTVRGGIRGTSRFNVPAAGKLRSRNSAPYGRTHTSNYRSQTGSRGDTRVLNLQSNVGGRFNGNPLTRIEMQRGTAFLNPNMNIVDRAFSDGANLKNSSRLNNDYRRYRAGYLYNFPQYVGNNIYGNQYAYAPEYQLALGAYGYAAYPQPFNQITQYPAQYPTNLYQAYPPASPECAPHLNCQANANPNDCRSCVSAQGGAAHCATQLCGPYVAY